LENINRRPEIIVKPVSVEELLRQALSAWVPERLFPTMSLVVPTVAISRFVDVSAARGLIIQSFV
jgi:hypothetical protein